MSGKAYTMKEMKAIVDYLNERRAYGEIKGRKMWVNFENSKFTDRSWQSLKETFLKRILPDIHNPYYQLSLVQITSFRQGYDVEAKLKNKLEVKPVSEGSSTDAIQPENIEQPSTSNNKDGENKSGEATISSKNVSDHRASAETIILDPCYDTAEEIHKELESPNQSAGIKDKDSEKSPTKTLRDFITYSEPLTPMLQEVIDDFATDEERDASDDEPQMEIAEDVENYKESKNLNIQTIHETVEISSGTDDVSNSNTIDMGKEGNNSRDEKQEENENDKSSQDKNISADNAKTSASQSIIAINYSENVLKLQSESSNVDDKNNKNIDLNENPPPEKKTESFFKTGTDKPFQIVNSSNVEKLTFSQNTCMENFSNNTTDTLIPNNQEVLSAFSQPTDKDITIEIPSKDGGNNLKKLSRKRAYSQETTASKPKKISMVLSSKSISVSDTDASGKRVNELKTNTNIIDNLKESNLQTSDKDSKTVNHKQNEAEPVEVPEEVTKEVVEEVINEKPSNQDKVDEPNAKGKAGDESVVENPCLKSVSLYDEQFSRAKYTESSDDVVKKTRPQKKRRVSKNQNLSDNEIVQLKSNSEDEDRQARKKKATTRNVRSERDQALANVFGFSSGGVTHSRKRRVSYQNKPRRQSHNKASSGSSEWTSESEAEFVSPPRGRRNRHARKYLKPKPARILSLEEEGGLFVMYGKKIYPVVKDGKIMKNVTYNPDRDSEDEEESFWKLKYIQEKKRTAQLTKLLQQSSNDDHHSCDGGSVAIDQKSSPKKRKIMKNETEVEDKNIVQEPVTKDAVEQTNIVSNDVKTLKIKITKQNEEVQLEGHWSQIHPVLNQVVQIFNKEVEPKSPPKSTTRKPSLEQSKTNGSGMSTPVVPMVDQEAHETVNKIETEIFKEIEALDKDAVSSTPQQPVPEKVSEVSKRRGRPRKSATPSESVSEIAEKIPKKMEPEKLPIQESVEQLAPAEIENNISPVTRKTRTPKKVLRENTVGNEGNVPNTRPKRTKETPSVAPIDDEANVRYKFPSPPPTGKKTTRRSSKDPIKEKTKTRYSKNRVTIFSPPDNTSMNSIESSQGYQDSDISPTLSFKKKKKYSATYHARGKFKNRLNGRRKTFLHLDLSEQSSNSCPELKHNSEQKSCSEIYRSESYQLLMPKNKNFSNNLERIDEVNLNDQIDAESVARISDTDINRACNFNSNTTNLYYDKANNVIRDATDVDNSSNVSLPPSPVLSIVENISINNNELNSFRDYILNKENAHNDLNKAGNNSDFKITDVDVTMPLVQQDYVIQSEIQNAAEQRIDVNDLPTVMTESFINKICTVNIHDNPTLSESINQKLRNLLLESAKKIAIKRDVTEASSDKMEIDSVQTKRDGQVRPKKRCSTPLKRRSTRRTSKRPEIEQSIEEEHTESCSQGGRMSCPPLIQISNDGLNIAEGENVTKDVMNKKKGRKKKENVIKVKILRPKTRNSLKETNTEKIAQKGESLHGDSGIIDTLSSVLLQGLDQSVDLIHNHSETCLQANDCVGDSVEFIENDTKSVISIDTNSDQSIDMERDSRINSGFRQNAQIGQFKNFCHNGTSLGNALEILRTNNTVDNEGTTYHTPLNSIHSASSILTEDLSDADQEVAVRTSSKWYLLSEDETNTNFTFPTSNNNGSYGADLNKIFPITCAIPDLSTITEMSNDKALRARASRNDSSSQSIFDDNIESNC